MVNIDDARIASYDNNGHHFEILVEPDLALEVRLGHKSIDYVINNLLATEEVYKNSKSGERASEKAIQETFNTLDIKIIADIILKKGHLDLTTDQKRRLSEAKRKEVIDYIVRNSINPMTKAPHPYTRVESSLESARIVIDIQKSIESQLDKIIEKLSPILPMDFKMTKIKTIIPIQFGGKINGVIGKYEILERKWEASSFYFIANVPAGEKDSFLNVISGITKGQAQFEME